MTRSTSTSLRMTTPRLLLQRVTPQSLFLRVLGFFGGVQFQQDSLNPLTLCSILLAPSYADYTNQWEDGTLCFRSSLPSYCWLPLLPLETTRERHVLCTCKTLEMVGTPTMLYPGALSRSAFSFLAKGIKSGCSLLFLESLLFLQTLQILTYSLDVWFSWTTQGLTWLGTRGIPLPSPTIKSVIHSSYLSS
jgi:hypothetical protein